MAHWNDVYANGVVVGAVTDREVAKLKLKPNSQVSRQGDNQPVSLWFVCRSCGTRPNVPCEPIVWAALQGRLELMTDDCRAATLALQFTTTTIPAFIRQLGREPERLPALAKVAKHHQVYLLQAAAQTEMNACAWLSLSFAYSWVTAVLTWTCLQLPVLQSVVDLVQGAGRSKEVDETRKLCGRADFARL